MTESPTLFESIPCPLCGSSRFQVIRKSGYPAGVTAEELSQAYSASSHQELMDQVVECSDCQMQYVNPRVNPEVLIGSYAAAEDPTFVEQNPDRIRTFSRMLKQAFGELGETSGNGRRILDVGCAGGAFLVAARDFGFKPVGVEPSRWLADYGRRTYNIDVRDGILEPGVFPEQSFDVITIWDVIEHVPDPHSVLTLIHSLLKPNGILLLSTPDVDSAPAKLMGSKWPFWLSVHLHYFTRATITKQLEKGGFHVHSIHRLWQTLPLAYVLRRAGHYFSPFHAVAALTDGIGIGKSGCSYYMGQAWVIARKK